MLSKSQSPRQIKGAVEIRALNGNIFKLHFSLATSLGMKCLSTNDFICHWQLVKEKEIKVKEVCSSVILLHVNR